MVAAPPDTGTNSEPASGQHEVLSGFTRLPRAIFLALSNERDQWTARLAATADAEYRRGLAEGYQRGWDQGRAHEWTCWMQYHAPAHAAASQLSRSRSYTELEISRYAPARWRGTVPDGLTGMRRRRWLAALPRRNDFKGVSHGTR